VFFANLGDFAGPGGRERHRHYLELITSLPIPDVCLIGNHDLEDSRAPETWTAVHGPRNFDFAYGHTRFVAIDGASGQAGELGDTTPAHTAGPPPEALEHLDAALAATTGARSSTPSRSRCPSPAPWRAASCRRSRRATARRRSRSPTSSRAPPDPPRLPRRRPPPARARC
jgi:hypothetical protein